MKLVEILTTLLLSLALVSSSSFSSEPNPGEVAVSSVPTQTSYSPFPTSELLSLLRGAILSNNPNQVRTLLENHVPLSQSPDEETSHQAASYSSTDTNISRSNERDINAAISDQGTLLHWAADRGHSDLIPVLLIRGADINSRFGRLDIDMTPLMCAAKKGHDAVVAQLLNSMATQPERIHSLITTQNNSGRTALHYAALSGHEAIVAQLLNPLVIQPEHIHSLITSQDNNGWTALHLACSNRNTKAVKVLLESYKEALDKIAPDTQPEHMHRLITTKDEYGWTALHDAAWSGQEAVVAQLLDVRATQPERIHSLITSQDNDGRTALYHAFVNCKTETVKLLLERYKEALDKIASDASSSAAELSSTCNDLVNLMNQEISWGLDQLTHDCVEIINLLVRFGANLDVRDENGDTHLHRAARTGHSAVVIALVANGAESQRNNTGKTPLDVAQGLAPEALSLLEERTARIGLQ